LSIGMTSPLPTATAPRIRAAERLWRAAVILLALTPVGMAVAHRSSPVFLIAATLLALLAALLEGRSDDLVRKTKDALATPLGRVGLAFFGWTLVSIAWSAFPATSAAAFGEFWLPVAAALVLSLALPSRVRTWGWWLFAGSLAVACVMIVYELHTGLALRRDLGMRAVSFIFNRPVLTILVCLAPVLAFLSARGPIGCLVAAVAAGLAVLAEQTSNSGAATLGLLVGGFTFVASLLASGWMRRLAMGAVVAVFAAAPFLGTVGDRLIPASVHQELADSHSRDRVDIWMSFGAAIREQPILGGGFGVSPRMADTPVATAVPPERRVLLGVGHPHNAAVQIWAELGIVGAALAAAILILVLQALGRVPRPRVAAMLALLAGICAVSLVGHGAWQGWWAAAIGAATVWFRSLPSLKHGVSR
jgi:exopolysaccharide production protein ExoQ